MSSGLGLMDFAIGLVDSVLNFLDKQVTFWGEAKLQSIVRRIENS